MKLRTNTIYHLHLLSALWVWQCKSGHGVEFNYWIRFVAEVGPETILYGMVWFKVEFVKWTKRTIINFSIFYRSNSLEYIEKPNQRLKMSKLSTCVLLDISNLNSHKNSIPLIERLSQNYFSLPCRKCSSPFIH